MPQLDGLRAFAVTAVAVSHWTPEFLIGIVPWGTGVQLFFVLSGFLITGILLRSRQDTSGMSLGKALRVFYIRRALRIFPVYYAVLAVALILSVGPIRECWPWHVSYLSNFYYAWHGHGPPISDPFLHFWSLGVEEQFYLLWPFVALVLSRRALLIGLWLAILGSVVFRTGIDRIVPGIVSIRYLTPSCLDAFAVGALVAHARHFTGGRAVRRLAWILAATGTVGLMLSVMVLPRLVGGETAHRIGHTFLVVFYGAIVAGAAEGFPGILGKLLSFGPVVYLGTVSYGIYIYHYFAPVAIHWLARWWGAAAWETSPMIVPVYALFTIVMSVASWHLFEAPINRLKKRVPYASGLPASTRGPDTLGGALPSAASSK